MAPRASADASTSTPTPTAAWHRRPWHWSRASALGWAVACALAARAAWRDRACRAVDAIAIGGGGDASFGVARDAAVRERNGAGAFVLRVDLTFVDAEDARALVRAWGEVADYARAHEPFLEHYEIARSDAEPLKYSIYERYRSKEDYLGPHKASAKFVEFRPKMRALEEQGKLFVSGASFVELGVGFVR